MDAEKREHIKFDYENGMSIYALAKKYNLSTATISKNRDKYGWQRADISERVDDWKTAQKESKEQLGYWIVKLVKAGIASTDALDPADHQALANLTRAAKNIADMVGAKTILDEQEQKVRIEALKKSLQKDTNTEPMKIEIQAPEEYLK